MKAILFILFVTVTTALNAQHQPEIILGKWYNCSDPLMNIGDTISFQRDSCRIDYVNNGVKNTLMHTMELSRIDAMMYYELDVIASGETYLQWEVLPDNLLVMGKAENGDPLRSYLILKLEEEALVVVRMK